MKGISCQASRTGDPALGDSHSHDIVELSLGTLATGAAVRGEGRGVDEDGVSVLGLAHLLGAAAHGALVDEGTDEDEEHDSANDDGDDGSSVGVIIFIEMGVDSTSKFSDLAWGEVSVKGGSNFGRDDIACSGSGDSGNDSGGDNSGTVSIDGGGSSGSSGSIGSIGGGSVGSNLVRGNSSLSSLEGSLISGVFGINITLGASSEATRDAVIGHDVEGLNLLDEGAHLAVKLSLLSGADESLFADRGDGELSGSHEAGLLVKDGLDLTVLDSPVVGSISDPFCALFEVVCGLIGSGEGVHVSGVVILDRLSVASLLNLVVLGLVKHNHLKLGAGGELRGHVGISIVITEVGSASFRFEAPEGFGI